MSTFVFMSVFTRFILGLGAEADVSGESLFRWRCSSDRVEKESGASVSAWAIYVESLSEEIAVCAEAESGSAALYCLFEEYVCDAAEVRAHSNAITGMIYC